MIIKKTKSKKRTNQQNEKIASNSHDRLKIAEFIFDAEHNNNKNVM